MIYSASLSGHLPDRLVALRNRRMFEFLPGLNILYGPNGCGKSTLLSSIAAHCSIPNGGWSRPVKLINLNFETELEFPAAYDTLCPAKTEARVEWNGIPSFFQSSRSADLVKFGYFHSNPDESDDGMTSMRDQVELMLQKPSTGEVRQMKLKQLLEALKSAPILVTKDESLEKLEQAIDADKNDIVSKQKLYYLKQRKKHAERNITVLLDEPESGLDVPTQVALWHNIIPDLVKRGYQVIVATQNPLVFQLRCENNLTDMVPGYLESCRTLQTLVTSGQSVTEYLRDNTAQLFPAVTCTPKTPKKKPSFKRP